MAKLKSALEGVCKIQFANKYGENIASSSVWGVGPGAGIIPAVEQWYAQETKYTYVKDSNFKDTAHFTQVRNN